MRKLQQILIFLFISLNLFGQTIKSDKTQYGTGEIVTITVTDVPRNLEGFTPYLRIGKVDENMELILMKEDSISIILDNGVYTLQKVWYNLKEYDPSSCKYTTSSVAYTNCIKINVNSLTVPIMYVRDTVWVNCNSVEDVEWILYPNPVSLGECFNIEFSDFSNEIRTIQIRNQNDLSGIGMINYQFTGNPQFCPQLSPGVYEIHLFANNHWRHKKLIVI